MEKLQSYLVIFFLALSLPATSEPSPGKLSLEVDPATYLLGGYSIHMRLYPDTLPMWRLGAGVYSMDMPDAFIDMNSDNRDENWDVEINRGVGLFAERYFDKSRTGWFVGVQTGTQKYELENALLTTGRTDYTSALLMPYGGYLQELTPNIYIQYWAGIGYNKKIDGSTTLAGEGYDIAPFIGFATLHLGYKF